MALLSHGKGVCRAVGKGGVIHPELAGHVKTGRMGMVEMLEFWSG